MPSSNGPVNKLQYPSADSRRPLLPHDDDSQHSPESGRPSRDTSYAGSFFEHVVEGIQERDRRRIARECVRCFSFVCAILSCLFAGSITSYSLYGHLFQSRLHYSQFQVNVVSIAAELALYLPASLVGYLCDRYGPGGASFLSAVFFGLGYLLAAFAYRSGPPPAAGGHGWPHWAMVVAFVGVGIGTVCMYLSAVTTCAKNFGRGKHKGLALAVPIAAFGLSGMWLSQVGSQILYERKPDGRKGDVDVFRYFVFLASLSLCVGLLGAVGLRIVDEEKMIDEAIEELAQSGLLEEDEFFHRAAEIHGYGTIEHEHLSGSTFNFLRDQAQDLKQKAEEERRRKNWLLNEETRLFLRDRTMWWLAAGFLLVTGPGEAFINNLGTVIGTLYPSAASVSKNTTAATHVSIVAISSTIARLITGTLTDALTPAAPAHQHRRPLNSLASSLQSLPPQGNPRKRVVLSRVVFLVAFALLMSVGQIVLASGVIQNHGERFWIVSGAIGAGYGAVFSLVPIILSVVWGVENFGTNWGIVALVPAIGAAVWGVVYSAVYQHAGRTPGDGPGGQTQQTDDALCYGQKCYAPTFWAMAASVWLACGLWLWAWKGPGGWSRRGIAV